MSYISEGWIEMKEKQCANSGGVGVVPLRDTDDRLDDEFHTSYHHCNVMYNLREEHQKDTMLDSYTQYFKRLS